MRRFVNHFETTLTIKNLLKMEFKDYLKKIGACSDARKWNADRNLEKCWQDCERGDWMLWLMKKADMCDLRTLTLAKARCAELAKPYIKDPRSLAALQAAFDFANGLISQEELQVFATATATYAAAATYAASAAAAAEATATYAASASYAASANAAEKKRMDILKQCANICREVLKLPKINGVEN